MNFLFVFAAKWNSSPFKPVSDSSENKMAHVSLDMPSFANVMRKEAESSKAQEQVASLEVANEGAAATIKATTQETGPSTMVDKSDFQVGKNKGGSSRSKDKVDDQSTKKTDAIKTFTPKPSFCR